jgi:ubiquinone biosynthesis protein
MTARASRREIDLASRPTIAIVWLARVFVRLCQIGFWLTVTTAAFPVFLIVRRSLKGAAGSAMTFLFQRLGSTFIKIGQIISTRPDVFSAEFIGPLITLQDRVPPFPFADVRPAIEEDFGRKLEEIFAEFDSHPVASASIAQVHRAVLQDAELPPSIPSRVVAVKVRRPGIVRRAYLDESIVRLGGRILSHLPTFSLLSPLEAVTQFCDAVHKQLDLRIEAENNRRFRKNFEDDSYVVFPALVVQLCSDRVLTMEFIDGVSVDKVRAIGCDPTFLARKDAEIVSRMIFHHGLVHADLHAGNVLFLPGNRTVLLDVGLVAVLDPEARRRFALFMYYSITGQGSEVARWLQLK